MRSVPHSIRIVSALVVVMFDTPMGSDMQDLVIFNFSRNENLEWLLLHGSVPFPGKNRHATTIILFFFLFLFSLTSEISRIREIRVRSFISRISG